MFYGEYGEISNDKKIIFRLYVATGSKKHYAFAKNGMRIIATAVFGFLLVACGGGGSGNGSGNSPLTPQMESNANWGVSAIRADYAHSRGYEGQGVTLFNGLHPYFIIPHFEITAALVNPPPPNNTIVEENVVRIYDHELVAMGLIVAERNNRGMVGIAPRGRLLSAPQRGTWQQIGLSMFLSRERPQVINHSAVSFHVKPQFNELRSSYSDFVWVNGRGNVDPPRYPRSTDAFLTLNEQEAKNWLSVAGVTPDLLFDIGSQPCGDEKAYCLVAPSHEIYAPGGGYYYSTTDFQIESGTSFAGPHVAGALMVMRSAAQEIHMTVHRQILLTTATDMGAPGVDDLYGHGLVNLSAAVDMIEARRTPAIGGSFPELSPNDFRRYIPSAFAHLGAKIGEAQIAFRLADDFYYNASLAKLLKPAEFIPSAPLGNATEDIATTPLMTIAKSGFVTAGNFKNGFSLRWNGVSENAALFAEFAHSPDGYGMLTGDFGALGNIKGKSNGGKIGMRRDLGSGFGIFGEYGYNNLQSNTSAGGYLAGTKNAKAESWIAGLEFTANKKHNRRFHLWAKERMRLSAGDLILRHPYYDGNLRVREKRIPLRQQREIIWSFGYAATLQSGNWATAMAYNGRSNEIKASAKWILNL